MRIGRNRKAEDRQPHARPAANFEAMPVQRLRRMFDGLQKLECAARCARFGIITGDGHDAVRQRAFLGIERHDVGGGCRLCRCGQADQECESRQQFPHAPSPIRRRRETRPAMTR